MPLNNVSHLKSLFKMSWYVDDEVKSFAFSQRNVILTVWNECELTVHTIQYSLASLHCCFCIWLWLKGLNIIHPRKLFCFSQTGKWALKPSNAHPTPHVERDWLIMGNAADGEQIVWKDKEPTTLLKRGVWLAAARRCLVYMGGVCVFCVHVVNSSKL